ncbi:MAG: YjfB family protein [Selenomonadaceae bacterium]|nr:YjfB family protein [Selenomonadaceae bacterium]
MAKTQQELGITVLKMAMESDASAVEETLQAIESLDPALGNNLDVTA